MLSKLCRYTFLSCKRYTELRSRSLDGDIGAKDRFYMYMHHMLCMVCRRFYRQLKLIHTGIAQLEEEFVSLETGPCLSDHCREKIRKEL